MTAKRKTATRKTAARKGTSTTARKLSDNNEMHEASAEQPHNANAVRVPARGPRHG